MRAAVAKFIYNATWQTCWQNGWSPSHWKKPWLVMRHMESITLLKAEFEYLVCNGTILCENYSIPCSSKTSELNTRIKDTW